jgi:hypothetical protein
MDTFGVMQLASQGHTLDSLEQQFSQMKLELRAAYHRWTASIVSLLTYLTIIGAVAVYDMILTARYSESLKQLEWNPIGRWLMDLDQIQLGELPCVAPFLWFKFAGTLCVLAIVGALVKRMARLGHPIACGVAGFQLVLGLYLLFGSR